MHDNVLVSCTHFATGHKLAVGLVDNDKCLEGIILTMHPEVFQKQLPQVFFGKVFWNEPVLGFAVIQAGRKTALLANNGHIRKTQEHNFTSISSVIWSRHVDRTR